MDAFKHIVITGDWRVFKHRYYWGYKSDHMGVGIPAQVSNVLHGPVVLIPNTPL